MASDHIEAKAPHFRSSFVVLKRYLTSCSSSVRSWAKVYLESIKAKADSSAHEWGGLVVFYCQAPYSATVSV